MNSSNQYDNQSDNQSDNQEDDYFTVCSDKSSQKTFDTFTSNNSINTNFINNNYNNSKYYSTPYDSSYYSSQSYYSSSSYYSDPSYFTNTPSSNYSSDFTESLIDESKYNDYNCYIELHHKNKIKEDIKLQSQDKTYSVDKYNMDTLIEKVFNETCKFENNESENINDKNNKEIDDIIINKIYISDKKDKYETFLLITKNSILMMKITENVTKNLIEYFILPIIKLKHVCQSLNIIKNIEYDKKLIPEINMINKIKQIIINNEYTSTIKKDVLLEFIEKF